MTFKNYFNSTPDKGEVNKEPSQTVPDQSLSIRTIMERYARGLPIDNTKTPIYHGDDEIPDLRRLDLSEVQELKEANQRQINNLQNDLAYAQQSAKKAKSGKASQTGEEKAQIDADTTLSE